MLGTTDLILIFGVATLLFGSSKLPELAKALGSSIGEFKKAQVSAEKEIKIDKEINELK